MARKYSSDASKKVEKAMHERKEGTLKSGRGGKTVKSRKQAIAIGLSEARKEGKKVPKRPSWILIVVHWFQWAAFTRRGSTRCSD